MNNTTQIFSTTNSFFNNKMKNIMTVKDALVLAIAAVIGLSGVFALTSIINERQATLPSSETTIQRQYK